MTLVAELHDFRRFESPRTLMSFLGLVPSENSTGEKHRRGAITKAGNTHARHVLIEASWHYRHRPGVSKELRKRREGQPGWVIALADRAQLRLHKKFWKLALHGKSTNKAVTAVARELAGFVWAALSVKASAATAT
jgi:transposase